MTRDERDASSERARNPTLVPGIYNYCVRLCERCPFTNRCLVYLENGRESARPSAGHLVEEIEPDTGATLDVIRAYREREGLDPEQIRGASIAEADAAQEACSSANAAAVERDPLHLASASYETAAYAVIDPLRQLSAFHDWPRDVAEALDTISWNAGAIRTKLYRALRGRAERGDDGEDDPVQNDWNGSAKVARLALAESVAAWDVLFAAGETPYDAPIRQRRRELEEIDQELARRFPQAMAFIRPGFDEPDVAAGELTAAVRLAPRRVTLRHRIKRWLAARFQR